MKKLNDEQRKLIEDNYSLIWHLHEKYFTKFKDFDTYMDLGRMAICKAALKWDESKGNFGTYFRWVLQMIQQKTVDRIRNLFGALAV